MAAKTLSAFTADKGTNPMGVATYNQAGTTLNDGKGMNIGTVT